MLTKKENKILPPIHEVVSLKSTMAYYKFKCKGHIVYILGGDQDSYIVFGFGHAHKAGLNIIQLKDLPKPVKRIEDFEPIDLALVKEDQFTSIIGKSDLTEQKKWKLEELQKEALQERPDLAQKEKEEIEDEDDQVLILPKKRR